MTPLDELYLGMQGMAGVFGALFGSFLNVCIVRMPEDRSVAWPGSACPHCGAGVRPYDNVPVFAWFWLRGRCRDCRTPFSALYPTIEAMFALLCVLLFRRIIPDVADVDKAHLVALVWYGWLLFALVGLTFIDLRHKIIPDAFSIYSVPVGVAGAALCTHLGFPYAPTWQQSVVGAATGGLGLYTLMALYRLVRKREGMGLGDAKLLALLGSYFAAIPALLFIVIAASVLGSIVGVATLLWRRGTLQLAMPFGPFLAVGAVVWLFFGDDVVVRWTGFG
ncbi:MAG: prepilin peptidase [Myxococcales bacterium]|nr:prepilin peptidase [Myxococcales bacterium]